MENKKQDVNSLEELVKTADSFRDFFANLAAELAKVLADIKAPEKEEDTWEMKYPYEVEDDVYVLPGDGEVIKDYWVCCDYDRNRFKQGNIFPTKEAALLESKRRNLLTRFKSFRDECNGDWKPESEKVKYYICLQYENLSLCVSSSMFWDAFNMFGYFKNEEDAQRAIELFGDEIKRLYVEVE